MSEKVSGENSYAHSSTPELGSSFVIDLAYFVHSTAMAFDSSLFMPKMIFWKQGLVARYRCRMAFLAPFKLSTVLLIKSLRQGDRTCSQTSSGTMPGVLTSFCVKLKSVSPDAGKETSISL